MDFLYEQFGFYSIDDLRIMAEEIMISASEFEPDIIDWQTVFTCIDHTSLNGTDHPGKIAGFTQRIKDAGKMLPGNSHVAAVCVYPVFAQLVSDILKDSPILTACVAGAFPSGLSPLKLRLEEVRYAIDNGADEIDMVISRGQIISGDYNFVFDEVSAFKDVCGEKKLKVILETGELNDPLHIARASEIALRAGADFLKTSTGKITAGSTPEALIIMMECIKAFHEDTGQKKGIKAAGGISEPEHALDCIALLKATLGEEWLTPGLFRIGASKLTEKVALKLLSLKTD
ncbi:MAG: deoxyribose-phosphate aldolase [Bacteroidales bacterium]